MVQLGCNMVNNGSTLLKTCNMEYDWSEHLTLHRKVTLFRNM